MNAIILLSTCLLTATPAQPIGLYDLTYALKFDAKDAKQVARTWDHCHAVATLQGNVNREAPNLYVRFVEAHGMNIDDYWLKRMSEPGQWLHDRPQKPVSDIVALVNTYRGFIKGVVVYDPNVAATSNLASTIAGVEQLIAIRYDLAPDSLYSLLVTGGPRLPVVKRLLNEDGSSDVHRQRHRPRHRHSLDRQPQVRRLPVAQALLHRLGQGGRHLLRLLHRPVLAQEPHGRLIQPSHPDQPRFLRGQQGLLLRPEHLGGRDPDRRSRPEARHRSGNTQGSDAQRLPPRRQGKDDPHRRFHPVGLQVH